MSKNKKLNFEQHLEEEQFELEERKAQHRRKMAYIALISMIIFTPIIFFFIAETKLEKLSDVIGWYYITMGSITAAYMGLSTYEGLKKNG